MVLAFRDVRLGSHQGGALESNAGSTKATHCESLDGCINGYQTSSMAFHRSIVPVIVRWFKGQEQGGVNSDLVNLQNALLPPTHGAGRFGIGIRQT